MQIFSPEDINIDVEFADHLYIIAAAGSGTTEGEFLFLENALQEISAAQRKSAAADSGKQNRKNRAENWQSGVQRNIAPARFRRRPAMTPRKAFSSRHETGLLSRKPAGGQPLLTWQSIRLEFLCFIRERRLRKKFGIIF